MIRRTCVKISFCLFLITVYALFLVQVQYFKESNSALHKMPSSSDFENDVKHETWNSSVELETWPEKCPRFIAQRRTFSHKECWNYTTRICEEGTLNATALVSYPGSGNTWLRHLIEISTGVFTGSVYFDEALYGRGFLGEKEDYHSGTTIAQKTHMKYDARHGFESAILLIRDPVMATRSFVDYLESGHTGWASPNTFYKKEWPMFLVQSTYDWISIAKSWIDAPINLLVIHYENLVDSPTNEIRKICNFLQIVDSRTRTTCFNKSLEGSFRRRKPHWKIKTLISSEFHEVIDNGIDFLNKLLSSRGHESIPLKKYRYYRQNSTTIVAV